MSPGPNFLGKPAPSSGPYTVVAHIYGKGNEEGKKLHALLTAVEKNANSDAEPDCTTYIVNVADDDPNTFVVYEEYKNQQAFKTHCDSEQFQAFAKVIPELTNDAHLRYFKHAN